MLKSLEFRGFLDGFWSLLIFLVEKAKRKDGFRCFLEMFYGFSLGFIKSFVWFCLKVFYGFLGAYLVKKLIK